MILSLGFYLTDCAEGSFLGEGELIFEGRGEEGHRREQEVGRRKGSFATAARSAPIKITKQQKRNFKF